MKKDKGKRPTIEIQLYHEDRDQVGLSIHYFKKGDEKTLPRTAEKIFKQHFQKLLKLKESGEIKNHYSNLEWIVIIHLDKRIRLNYPIGVRLNGKEKKSTHIVVILEEGSEAVVFEEINGNRFSHGTEVFVNQGAKFEYVSLKSSGSVGCIFQRAEVGDDAAIHWHTTTIGGSGDTHDLVSRAGGRESKSSIDWIFFVKEKEKLDLSARTIFDGPFGGGEMVMKGVAQDRAGARCKGMIEIGERGSGTKTFLSQKMLMLDPSAKIEAVPALEIRTNDVRASHSATVSRVTPEDLFYMKSRGITEATARRMYVEGFLSDLTEKVPNEIVRVKILSALRDAYSK